MTRGLALDLKPIRVNLVSPGPLDTELWKDYSDEDGKKSYRSVAEQMPTGRIAKRKCCF
jgi:NAD(P)-dependent dehydrogenase (short-subunit alcohol dehydrogenase family)